MLFNHTIVVENYSQLKITNQKEKIMNEMDAWNYMQTALSTGATQGIVVAIFIVPVCLKLVSKPVKFFRLL